MDFGVPAQMAGVGERLPALVTREQSDPCVLLLVETQAVEGAELLAACLAVERLRV